MGFFDNLSGELQKMKTQAKAETTNYIDSGQCGENLYWNLKDNGELTISGSGRIEKPRVSSKPDSKWYPWLLHREKITSIVVRPGVNAIGDYAFFRCTNLEHVDLPDSLVRIGEWSFSHCEKLESIRLPDNIREIEDDTFCECDILKEIGLPAMLCSIGYGAFKYCKSLETIVLPECVSSMNMNAFDGCIGIKAIYADKRNPEFLTIEQCLYSKNKEKLIRWIPGALGTAIIPDGVVTIGEKAFCDCTGLTRIVIPDSVTSIESAAFQNCINLESLDIPERVTSIESEAFENCCSLKKLDIPRGVTHLGGGAFNKCRNIERIALPDGLTRLENGLFRECDHLKQVELPESLSEIGDGVFNECFSLESVKIPDHVTNIEGWAFSECHALKEITIPEGVTKIRRCTFNQCKSLEHVDIPDTVTDIKREAFSGCVSLKEIRLPEHLISIGQHAFQGCLSLEEIRLPSTLYTIGYGAFLACRNLRKAVIPEEVFLADANQIFGGCDHLDVSTLCACAPPDTAECAIQRLNNSLDRFFEDYLDTYGFVYGFWLAEVIAPAGSDIGGKVEEPDDRLMEWVLYAIEGCGSLSKRDTYDIAVQMTNLIMQTLHEYQGEIYVLSPQGKNRYGDDEDRFVTLHGLVKILGEKEHWYAVFSLWSD